MSSSYIYATLTPLDNELSKSSHYQTLLTDINDNGQIVGWYSNYDSTTGHGDYHSFISFNGETYTQLQDLDNGTHTLDNLNGTTVEGINNFNQIVGEFFDDTGTRGFLATQDTNGIYTYTTLDYLGTGGTSANDIDDAGQIVGYYNDGTKLHGLLYSGGSYTILDHRPDDLANMLTGINNSGQIVGWYQNSSGAYRYFVYKDGTYTDLDVSVAAPLDLDINDTGQIVINTYPGPGSDGHEHLIYSGGNYVPLKDFYVGLDLGINNAGQIVGSYRDPGDIVDHSFLATPSEPSETIRYEGSGLVFENLYNFGENGPYRSAIIAAENYLQAHFTDALTIKLDFSKAAIGGAASNIPTLLKDVLSPSQLTSSGGYAYHDLLKALAAKATSADDASAIAALNKLADPTGGVGFQLTLAEAKALGLWTSNDNRTDGVVYLNSNESYFWNGSPTPGDSNSFDAIGALEHEISEEMGRIGGLGFGLLGVSNYWGLIDLFRWVQTANGLQRDYSAGDFFFDRRHKSADIGLRASASSVQ
jgi:probable HAF family extracellular repeat protein